MNHFVRKIPHNVPISKYAQIAGKKIRLLLHIAQTVEAILKNSEKILVLHCFKRRQKLEKKMEVEKTFRIFS
jgi:hypothetical protein